MRRFTDLYVALDETKKTSRKLAALEAYFAEAPAEDAAWAVYFLSGRRIKRLVPSKLLRQWCAEAAGLPEWLVDESRYAVGDSAETMALLLPPGGAGTDAPLHHWVEHVLLAILNQPPDEQEKALKSAWRTMNERQRFVWNKLITGEFRVGVSQRLVIRALAKVANVDPADVAHRLMGGWDPTPEGYHALIAQDTNDTVISRPYPFFLAYPYDDELDQLGDRVEWLVEWKWDGVRAQLIRRADDTWLWSRGEELITERFPEVAKMSEGLPNGTVLDGEILAWKEGRVLPFGHLQRRIGRKKLTPKLLSEIPAVFLVFDVVEWGGADIRRQPLAARRESLESIVRQVNDAQLKLSPKLDADNWRDVAAAREGSRDRGVEGVMIKRLDSPYGVGRQRGDWWKWKIEPYSVDAVLIYAQRGNGRRASLYSDYTFAVWDGEELVPFAKAYSGLTDAEIRKVDSFVRRNTVDKFGPVRQVKPELVFELGFEGIRRSTRHKSGVAVRFPRMLSWRTDKKANDADTIETVHALLPPEER